MRGVQERFHTKFDAKAAGDNFGDYQYGTRESQESPQRDLRGCVFGGGGMTNRQKPELACCEMCGRDTKNKSRICRRCCAGVSKHSHIEDDDDDDEFDSIDVMVQSQMREQTQ
jgi:hypothetical protein